MKMDEVMDISIRLIGTKPYLKKASVEMEISTPARWS